jgi:hypothetical protein
VVEVVVIEITILLGPGIPGADSKSDLGDVSVSYER